MTVSAQAGEFGFAVQYAKYNDGTVTPLKARGNVRFISQPNDADTLTIGAVVYRFKTVPAAAGDILIGATLALTLANLIAATTGAALPASAYFAGTKPLLLADAELGTQTIFLTAVLQGQAGNSVSLAQLGGSSARYVLSGSTLTGGQNGGDALAAIGRVVVAAMPLDTETLTIGGSVYVFNAASGAGLNIDITTNNTRLLVAAAIGVKLATNADVDAASVVVSGATVTFKSNTTGSAENLTVLSETVAAAASVQVTGAGTFLSGQNASVFTRSALAWRKVRAREVAYDANNMGDTIPLEVGGNIEPLGAYKSGVAVGGSATVMPRLENDFGWLLLAALGKCTTVNNGDGTWSHTFVIDTANETNLPWLSVRKMVPGRSSGEFVEAEGLTGFDNIVAGMRFTVPQMGPVEAMTQFIGRVPELDNHPEAWINGGSYENAETIPISCNGSFKLPTIFSSNLPVTQVLVELANGVTGPREEFVIGSYFMDDIIARTRAMTLRFMYKWKSPEFYQRMFGNASRATVWSPSPFLTKTNGGNYAFDLLLESPKVIGVTAIKHSLRVRSNTCWWQPNGPILLQGGGIVMQEITGTVLVPDSGAYVEFVLTNGTSAYAMPTEP